MRLCWPRIDSQGVVSDMPNEALFKPVRVGHCIDSLVIRVFAAPLIAMRSM